MLRIILLIISLITFSFSYIYSGEVEIGSTGNELEISLVGYPGNLPVTALTVTVVNKPDWITFVLDSSTVKEVEEVITIPSYTDSTGEHHSEKEIVTKKNISQFTFKVSSKVDVGTKGNILLTVKDDKGRSWNKNIDIEVAPEGTKRSSINPSIGEKALPAEFDLFQNYPNPFNPETSISFALSKDRYTTLRIYDISGRLIKTLINELKTTGYYSIKWNGTNEKGEIVPSGLYLYQITSGEYSTTKRMLLLK